MKRVEIPIRWGTKEQIKVVNVNRKWKLLHTNPDGCNIFTDINPLDDVILRVVSHICSYCIPLAEQSQAFRNLKNFELRKQPQKLP